jgi:hypothetical protein
VVSLTTRAVWLPLCAALARRQDAGLETRLWLRDDDAVMATAALDRLLGLTGDFAMPVAIAVVPALTSEVFAQYLAGYLHATPVIHGWNHTNYAPAGEKKQEFGDNRHSDIVLADLSAALQRMVKLHGNKLVPMLVPPWNRIGTNILPHLAELGFTALSCFGDSRFETPVSVINTHVDLIDWHGTGGCREHPILVAGLIEQLHRTGQTNAPIGILGHHLVHDGAAWRFLEELFELTTGFSSCHWLSITQMIATK